VQASSEHLTDTSMSAEDKAAMDEKSGIRVTGDLQ
jgi:hypothetical protein